MFGNIVREVVFLTVVLRMCSGFLKKKSQNNTNTVSSVILKVIHKSVSV
jgi:hypothetical protein